MLQSGVLEIQNKKQGWQWMVLLGRDGWTHTQSYMHITRTDAYIYVQMPIYVPIYVCTGPYRYTS